MGESDGEGESDGDGEGEVEGKGESEGRGTSLCSQVKVCARHYVGMALHRHVRVKSSQVKRTITLSVQSVGRGYGIACHYAKIILKAIELVPGCRGQWRRELVKETSEGGGEWRQRRLRKGKM